MALFGLIFLVVTLILIGVGLAIGLVACLVTTVLIGAGIVSSSFLIGLYSKRPAIGIRVFLLQFGFLAGILPGAGCAWLIELTSEKFAGNWRVVIYGAVGGAFAGVLMALLLDFTSRYVGRWASARFAAVSSPDVQVERNA